MKIEEIYFLLLGFNLNISLSNFLINWVSINYNISILYQLVAFTKILLSIYHMGHTEYIELKIAYKNIYIQDLKTTCY